MLHKDRRAEVLFKLMADDEYNHFDKAISFLVWQQLDGFVAQAK